MLGPTARARPRPWRSSRACARPTAGSAQRPGPGRLARLGGAQGAHRRPAPDRRPVPQPDRDRDHRPVPQLLPPGPGPTAELIEALDLGERRDAQTKDLSGGQRQRLSVALALVNEPEVLFLDEPTTGLDPQARRSLWDLVLGLKAAGTTVLLTTHYMEEAEQLCDRLAIMDHGKVLEMGTVEELVARRFQELSVRFDTLPGLEDARLAALPGVSRVMHEDDSIALYTADVAATIGGLLAAAGGAGHRARQPGGAAGDPRGRVPRPDRPGAPGLTRCAPLLALTRANIRSFVRDRAALFWTIAFPILFVILFGSIFSGGGPSTFNIGWVDLDGSPGVGRRPRRVRGDRAAGADRRHPGRKPGPDAHGRPGRGHRGARRARGRHRRGPVAGTPGPRRWRSRCTPTPASRPRARPSTRSCPRWSPRPTWS